MLRHVAPGYHRCPTLSTHNLSTIAGREPQLAVALLPIGTSVGFYIGAYALYYMHYEAKMDVIGAEMVYLIWTGFATFNFCAFFGMVSFSASAVFVAELFSHVRID